MRWLTWKFTNLYRRQPEYPMRGGHTKRSEDVLDMIASAAIYTAGKKGVDLVPADRWEDRGQRCRRGLRQRVFASVHSGRKAGSGK